MRSVYGAIYLAIFIQFVRNVFEKVQVSVTVQVPVSHGDGDYYVMVDGHPFTWHETKEEALEWCWTAIAKCRSLESVLKINQASEDMVLEAAEGIPGLCVEEILALNETCDQLD